VGNRIRQARLERGWSKAKLADRANVTPSYVGRLEKGHYKRPSMEHLTAVANALGRRVSDLLDRPAPELDVDLLDQLRELIGADEGAMTEIVTEIMAYPSDQRAGALRFVLQALRLARTLPVPSS
jgi:transcriptional regulator with XRE-family HTH domain